MSKIRSTNTLILDLNYRELLSLELSNKPSLQDRNRGTPLLISTLTMRILTGFKLRSPLSPSDRLVFKINDILLIALLTKVIRIGIKKVKYKRDSMGLKSSINLQMENQSAISLQSSPLMNKISLMTSPFSL